MINQISSCSPYLTVSLPIGYDTAGSGPVWWNGNSQCLEVLTHPQSGYGSPSVTGIPLQGKQVTIDTTGEMTELLMWVKQKQQEELRLNALMENCSALKDLKEQFDVMVALVQNNAK